MPKHPTAVPPTHIAIVLDPADSQATRDQLARLALPRHGQVLVTPTPGAADRATLALDLIAALGKNPAVIGREGTRAWALAAAWLTAQQPTDVIVDRAHLLAPYLLADIADLAQGAGAALWLIWSGPQDHRPALDVLRGATRRTTVVDPEQMDAMIPAAPQAAIPAILRPALPPNLPTADFPLFLAACRRHLKPREFDAVADLYHRAAQRTDAYLDTHTLRAAAHDDQYTHQVAHPLTRWLRDQQLGPAATATEALIILRATQAALFLGGILLCWDRTGLGEHAERHLPTALSAERTLALSSAARTDAAAAAVLSLHLCQPPARFDCWSLRDITNDGRFLHPADIHRHHARPGPSHRAPVQPTLRDAAAVQPPCMQPILLPEHAAPFIAAHLAYRRAQGAEDGDRYFIHPTHQQLSVAGHLHTGIQHTFRQINLDTPWMHGIACPKRTSDDSCQRRHGWLAARGLSIHRPDSALTAPLHRLIDARR